MPKLSRKERLAEIARILETVDNRCMAVDGPVTPTKDEITKEELREIYLLAKGKKAAKAYAEGRE